MRDREGPPDLGGGVDSFHVLLQSYVDFMHLRSAWKGSFCALLGLFVGLGSSWTAPGRVYGGVYDGARSSRL